VVISLESISQSGADGVIQVVEYLPSKHEFLSSNPGTKKKKKKKDPSISQTRANFVIKTH
jgi:hypothetical protein